MAEKIIPVLDTSSSDSSDSEPEAILPDDPAEPENDLEQLIAMSLIDKEHEILPQKSNFGFKIQEVKSLAPEAKSHEPSPVQSVEIEHLLPIFTVSPEQHIENLIDEMPINNSLPPPPPLKLLPQSRPRSSAPHPLLKVRSLEELTDRPQNNVPSPPVLIRKRTSNPGSSGRKRRLGEHSNIAQKSTNFGMDVNNPVAETSKNITNSSTSNSSVTNPNRRKSQITSRVLDDEDDLFANATLNQDVFVPPPPKENNTETNLLRTVAFLRVSVNHILEKIEKRPIIFDRKRPTLASLVYKYSKC